MRWERRFADLEARLEAEERATWEGDVADLIRAERGQLTLPDRLRAHIGNWLTWALDLPEQLLEGELIEVGSDWILVKAASGETLIPIEAVLSVGGLSRAARTQSSEVVRRLRLGVVLRGLSRDRSVVSVRLRGGPRITGTIDRVGADHLDLAVHAGDLPRRGAAVIEVRCLPIRGIACVVVC
jgi:hypothetical protein